MVRAFVEQVNGLRDNPWTIYPETAGWDLLMAHRDGHQLGIEAKLSLNAKVIDQAIVNTTRYHCDTGPDYRAVLVPEGKVQHHLGTICTLLGVGIIAARDSGYWSLSLPDERWGWKEWPNWCPAQRCVLPDYVPDVEGGHACPVQLTPWKIKAIKLMILLQRRGFVTRADMKRLEISPTRWTDGFHGFLDRKPEVGGFVACRRTPDLRAQHPTNYAEIEADFEKWGLAFRAEPETMQLELKGAA